MFNCWTVKVGIELVSSSHVSLGMWLLIHASIKFKPFSKKGPQRKSDASEQNHFGNECWISSGEILPNPYYHV